MEREELERSERAAERRGAEWAGVKAELVAHERRLDAINGSIGRAASEVSGLREDIRKVVARFDTATAVAEARAADLKKATENQVSTRTFVVSLLIAVIALAALIAGVHF